MEILAQFRTPADFAPVGDFAAHLVRLWPVVDALSKTDGRLGQWFLKADTEEEARLYRLYDGPGIPSTAILAVLAQRYEKKMDRPKVFGFWNGHMSEADRATLKLAIDSKSLPSEIEVALPRPKESAAGLGSYAVVAEIVSRIASTYNPIYVSVSLGNISTGASLTTSPASAGCYIYHARSPCSRFPKRARSFL